MKITLHGAAGEVTGSAYHVETDRASVLVDFGLFQGGERADERNRVPPELNARKLDAVILTHGHLDHTGRLPLLVKDGYRRRIHATEATIELSSLILRDSARIQEGDAERFNKKRGRASPDQPGNRGDRGRPLEPLYSTEDAERALDLLEPLPYDEPVAIAPGITIRLSDSGHMLGSVSIEMTVEEGAREKRVVFSGDIGPRGMPFLRDAVPFSAADLVFLESTYGDRDHRPLRETVAEFEEIVKAAVAQKGKVLVPAFAIGRAQTILYYLAAFFRRKVAPPFPVYLDSPMAVEALRVYDRHPELLDEEASGLKTSDQLRRDLSTLRLVASREESKAINDDDGPCLIIAGAGMCSGGRILHHLKRNLWRPETWVVIAGYQSEGSLGRRLVDGRKQVSIFGERVEVKAKVCTLGGFSAHAGKRELLEWIGAMAASGPRVVLTHGEERGRAPLAERIREKFKLNVDLPGPGAVVTV